MKRCEHIKNDHNSVEHKLKKKKIKINETKITLNAITPFIRRTTIRANDTSQKLDKRLLWLAKLKKNNNRQYKNHSPKVLILKNGDTSL